MEPTLIDGVGYDLEEFRNSLAVDQQGALDKFLSTRSVASTPSLKDAKGFEKHLIYKGDYDEFVAQMGGSVGETETH